MTVVRWVNRCSVKTHERQLLLFSWCWRAAFTVSPVWRKSWPWHFSPHWNISKMFKTYAPINVMSSFEHLTKHTFWSPYQLRHPDCTVIPQAGKCGWLPLRPQWISPRFQAWCLCFDSFDTCNIYHTLFSISIFDVTLMPCDDELSEVAR